MGDVSLTTIVATHCLQCFNSMEQEVPRKRQSPTDTKIGNSVEQQTIR